MPRRVAWGRGSQVGQAIDFVEEPFDIVIRRGNVVLTWPDGRSRALPLDVFRMCFARAGKALAKFDAERGVVPIRARAEH